MTEARVHPSLLEENPFQPEECRSCGSAGGCCFFLCPCSPHYYSPEREREDAMFNDSLSHSEWFSAAVRQYEAVHGEPYVS